MGRGLTGALAAVLAASIGDLGGQMERASRITDSWSGALVAGRTGGRHRVARELAAKARIAKRKAKRGAK